MEIVLIDRLTELLIPLRG